VSALVPFLAARHVRSRGLQSALTIGGVAVGVAVLLVALSLTNGFVDELIGSTLRATPHVALQPWSADGSLAADDATLEALRREPGVTAVAPFVAGQALIARRADATRGVSGRQGFAQLLGIDPEAHARVLDLGALERAAPAFERAEGVVLGASLAAQLGVVEGDTVVLRELGGRTLSLTVAGTFRVGNELIDAVTAYVPLARLQAYLDLDDRWSGVHVRLDDPTEATAAGERLGDRYGLRPTSWERLFSGLLQQLRLQKAVISVVVFLIVLVAAMGIANVLVLAVAEKTGEIAVLRTLGASARQVMAVFTLEGAVLGGLGTVLGAGLGLAVAAYFRWQPYPLPGDLYFITQLPVTVQPFDVVWVCAVSFATSVLASVVPARRAAALRPADVLR
jgi:lipoprotein-releasing system permease protein